MYIVTIKTNDKDIQFSIGSIATLASYYYN